MPTLALVAAGTTSTRRLRVSRRCRACLTAPRRHIFPTETPWSTRYIRYIRYISLTDVTDPVALDLPSFRSCAFVCQVPIDWVSVSHYGTGLHTIHGEQFGNFPGADYVQRTPSGKAGEVELVAMRELAERPQASLEVHEWSILKNELGQDTYASSPADCTSSSKLPPLSAPPRPDPPPPPDG